MTITRCVDLSAARWLEQRDEDWRRLAARGPRCYDGYARLRIIPDPAYPGQSEGEVQVGPDALSDNEQIGTAFVWPADRAWCVTCDIDPHFASIGASAAAIDQLLTDARVDVVADDPDVEPPYYC